VPFEVRTPVLQEFRDRVKAINPEAYIVGEVWEIHASGWDGTQFDGDELSICRAYYCLHRWRSRSYGVQDRSIIPIRYLQQSTLKN